MEHFADRGYDVSGYARNCFPGKITEEDTIINCASSGYRKGSYGIKQTVFDNYELPVILDDRRNGANFIQIATWVEEVAPYLPYAASKVLASAYLKDKAHICMACSIFGGEHESPDKFLNTFLKACASGEPYTVYQPFSRRDFVHIEKFCNAIEDLTKHKLYMKRYFATGRMISFWQVYVYLKMIAGRDFPNITFAEDITTKYDWYPQNPMFEDTFRADLEREWNRING